MYLKIGISKVIGTNNGFKGSISKVETNDVHYWVQVISVYGRSIIYFQQHLVQQTPIEKVLVNPLWTIATKFEGFE